MQDFCFRHPMQIANTAMCILPRGFTALSGRFSTSRVEADYLFVQPKQIRGLSVGLSESAIYCERPNLLTILWSQECPILH